jgi:hypothetical protein
MRDNRWSSGLAFGLIGGLTLSALLLAWLSDGPPSWWKHDGALVTSKDTLANWLVAIFSFIAAILLWLTLRATQAMAKDTRAIGEAQVRAYLSIVKISAAVDPASSHPTIEITVRNAGQSPARRIEIVVEFSFFPDPRLSGFISLERQIGVFWLNDIPSGQEAHSRPTQLGDVVLDRRILGEDFAALMGIHVDIVVYSFDVFDQEILAYGHYATGWAPEDDKSLLRSMNDLSSVSGTSYLVDRLRRQGRKPNIA